MLASEANKFILEMKNIRNVHDVWIDLGFHVASSFTNYN